MHICGALVQKAVIATLLLSSPLALFGEEILVRTPTGNSITFEIDPNDSFGNILQNIEIALNEVEGFSLQDAELPKPIFIDYMSATPCSSTYRGSDTNRLYSSPVTAEEKKDIRYLLTKMATSSWTQLLSSRSSMNKAGDRIDHVHPLRFLQCVFTDEELKGCLHSIRDRSLIWKNFFSGISESFQEESDRNNMKPEYVQDFAASLKINPALISGPIKSKKWLEFIDILLANLPRTGDPGRYDM